MIWSVLQNPLLSMAALPGAAFVFLVPYTLWKERAR